MSRESLKQAGKLLRGSKSSLEPIEMYKDGFTFPLTQVLCDLQFKEYIFIKRMIQWHS